MRKSIKIALLLLMFIACVGNLQAQDRTKEMLEYKHDFIVKETGMSQDQRSKFMPLYEAMEKEIYNVNHNARQQAKKIKDAKKVSDDQYAKAARAIAEVKSKEGEIETRYFNKFATILSKEQLFKLKIAEIKFYREMTSKKKK